MLNANAKINLCLFNTEKYAIVNPFMSSTIDWTGLFPNRGCVASFFMIILFYRNS